MKFTAWAAVLVVSSLVAIPAQAALSVGDTIRFEDREGTVGGGEYAVYGVSPFSANELFRTFCVQTTEFLDFNAAGFKIVGITDHTVAGNDQISPQTAYLFAHFSMGDLGHYDYTPAPYNDSTYEHDRDANDLQKALWYFEGETSTTFSNLPTESQQWITEANNAVSSGAWSGLDGVSVLNITWATSRGGHYKNDNAQDVLYWNPPPPPPPGVPEPASIAVWSLLGLSLGWTSWRRRRRAQA